MRKKSTQSGAIPVTVQHSASRGSHRSDSAQLGVNLLAGKLQGTLHFHSALVEIGQNERGQAFDTWKTAVFECV